MKQADSFFDFAAAVGLTKHLGGQDATKELIDRTRLPMNDSVKGEY